MINLKFGLNFLRKKGFFFDADFFQKTVLLMGICRQLFYLLL